MKRRKFSRAAAARVDAQWHNYQLARNAMVHAEQQASSRINFSIFDKLPKDVRKLIDELGPEAPDWANEWFATGKDPRRRQKEAPVYPYQRQA